MFGKLSKSLIKIVNIIKNYKIINKDLISSILDKLKNILLESDVSVKVIDKFIIKIKKDFKHYINNINQNLGKILINIIKKELINILSYKNIEINLSDKKISIILLVGLQGVGKTITTIKLGKLIKKKYNKKVLLTSVDVYRPAGIKQLYKLSIINNIDFFKSNKKQKPIDIIKLILRNIKNKDYDVLIIDTPGISYSNENIKTEIKKIYDLVKPIETLLVFDSMTGQNSVNISKIFKKFLKITGIFLTKVDSDTKGGSALSICDIIKKPIKFLGIGEHSNDIEKFHPDRIVSRILGMGDIESLIEEVKDKIKLKDTNKILYKINKGIDFNLNDFLEQIKQINKMGGINSILEKFPFLDKKFNFDEKKLIIIENVINSMTKMEKEYPHIINISRINRISLGSGVKKKDVKNVINQFYYMKNIMKKIKGANIKQIIKNLKNILPENIKNFF
ncbi:signal recognition particle receptor subunit alpha [Candidatus Annandia pinicola]|uniref:signal recognition particle receptor subunit alpha n=1 Tax=Candidatus Annandia pinicola TaxID=1345117 RepID=UPI001D00DE60|nr:signal recognition particle receptor subunit alpha [Candidatus Annandia pinicola]UDG80427.1 Signal recognition particle protein [Candidatus Annandia pinicola]